MSVEIRKVVDAIHEDHTILLSQLRDLEEAFVLAGEKEEEESRVFSLLNHMRLHFWQHVLLHLQKEEREFIPAVERLPDGDRKAGRIREEHKELRRAIGDFKSALTLATYSGPETRKPLLWRLIAETRTILARLSAHAAYETELIRELTPSAGSK